MLDFLLIILFATLHFHITGLASAAGAGHSKGLSVQLRKCLSAEILNISQLNFVQCTVQGDSVSRGTTTGATHRRAAICPSRAVAPPMAPLHRHPAGQAGVGRRHCKQHRHLCQVRISV